jgi:hypothetical protein
MSEVVVVLDVKKHYVFNASIRPQVATATVIGSAIDLENTVDGFAELIVGAVSGGSPTLDVKLQEAETSAGPYSDIPGTGFTRVVAANAQQVITFRRTKRWVRAVGATGGSSPSFAFAVSLFGRKRVL